MSCLLVFKQAGLLPTAALRSGGGHVTVTPATAAQSRAAAAVAGAAANHRRPRSRPAPAAGEPRQLEQRGAVSFVSRNAPPTD